MSKLVIFGIIAVIFLLIYLRMRPFIRAARQIFGVAREVRRVSRDGQPGSKASVGDRLVRCASCSTWVPSSRSVKLHSSDAAYCSHDCLEQSARGAKRKAG